MKLTKVELTEGIKLSEVKDEEWIYESFNTYILTQSLKEDLDDEYLYDKRNKFVVIRENKVIPIIKDQEYDNNKPYLVGKDENHIVGVIVYYDSLNCYKTISNAYGINDERNTTLQYLITNLNHKGYNVYKQE